MTFRKNASADLKTVQVWGNNSQTGGPAKTQKVIKLLDLIKCHSTVSTIAYSQKFRVSQLPLCDLIGGCVCQLYLVIANDFKFVFMNELFNVIGVPMDMASLSQVKQAHFYDEKDQLITGGVRGVFIHSFDYSGKYTPKMAAQVDQKGLYINI